jgi:hypothetical protein
MSVSDGVGDDGDRDDGDREDEVVEDVAQALTRELSLDIGEADVAIVASVLAGGRRGDRFRVVPPSTLPSPTLRLALVRILATGAIALLAEHGARQRTVLRRGRRITGGLLDEDVNVGDDGVPFTLRCSPAVVYLVMRLCAHALPLGAPSPDATPAATRARQLAEQTAARLIDPWPTVTPGDDVVYALVLANLERLELSPTLVQTLRAALGRASPLCALLSPEGTDRNDVEVDALLAPGAVRVLECLLDVVAAAWARAPRLVWNASDLDGLAQRSRATCALARRYLRALDDARRLDLVGPVAALVGATATAWPSDARARLLEKPGVQAMAERERAIAALREIADVGAYLDALRVRMSDERYGDDRFDEAQLVLAVLREQWLPRRDDVAAMVQRLTGAVA